MRMRVQLFAEGLHEAIGPALQEEMKIELEHARERTPIRDGFLRGSYKLGEIERWGKSVRVGILVGGAEAPYALYVHENLDAHHEVGEPKFLERTLRESRPFMAARVARRLELQKLVG